MPISQPLMRGVAVASPRKASRPRLHFRLNARSLDNLPRGRHFDGDGLMVLVTRNLTRSWVLRMMHRGKRRDIGLGSLKLVTLAQARDLSRELRAVARSGDDPRAFLAKRRAPVMPFRDAAKQVHAEHQPSWKNPKHGKQWISTVEQYACPVLGDMPVGGIRSEHIVRALSPIWLARPETSRRVLQRIGTILLWAKGNGHRPDSPTDEIRAARKALPRQNDQEQHHAALPYPDLPDFIRRLRDTSATPSVKLGLEFLILTAARTNEVVHARWPEIDLANRVWIIPAPRMKAKREHRVPLGDRCVAILREARQLNSKATGYVFPGRATKPLSTMAFLMLLRRMRVPVTAHGFRSTFRVWCAEQTNMPREIAEAALAHILRDATEAAYMRSTFFEKRRALMEQWERASDPGEVTGSSQSSQPEQQERN